MEDAQFDCSPYFNMNKHSLEIDHALVGARISQWNKGLYSYAETPFENDDVAFLVADILRSSGIETHHETQGERVTGVIRGNDTGSTLALTVQLDPRDFLAPDLVPYLIRQRTDPSSIRSQGQSLAMLIAVAHLARKRHFSGTVIVHFLLDYELPGVRNIKIGQKIGNELSVNPSIEASELPAHANDAAHWVQRAISALDTL